jgi:thiosulfate/3-mercaptopyruvate sulfurtransferase
MNLPMLTHRIDANQLNALSAVTLFDCCHDLMKPDWGRAQYATAHIPFARFAALDTDLSAAKTGRNGRHPLPARDVFVEWLARQGVTTHTQIVCYDQLEGMYAARLWWMCRWAGFANVAVLEGGYSAWQAAGGAVTNAVHIPIAAPAMQLPALERVLSVDQVLGNLDTPTFCMVDARAPERYRGEIEPIDAVAGHIPGALNRVYKSNLNAQSRFIDDLAQQWQGVQRAAGSLPLAHQCGSGVTACHNILALHVAGLVQADEASLLYAGSWSEWSSDTARPVATGA